MKTTKIVSQDKDYGFVIDMNFNGPVNFPTSAESNFQLGGGVVNEFKDLQAHVHNEVERKIVGTSEFLYVREGKMDINILDEKGLSITKISLESNMGLLQFIGGHKIDIYPNTHYFEIKQGPYMGKEKDKTLIDL